MQKNKETGLLPTTCPGQDAVPTPTLLSPYPCTSGTGQQAQLPELRLQQVLSAGQLVKPSQWMSRLKTCGSGKLRGAMTFFIQGTRRAPISQDPVSVWHWNPVGQQCIWSSQHTAYGGQRKANTHWSQASCPSAWTRMPTAPRYLGKGTAAPVPSGEAAASVPIWAAHLHVTLHLLHYRQKTCHQRHQNQVCSYLKPQQTSGKAGVERGDTHAATNACSHLHPRTELSHLFMEQMPIPGYPGSLVRRSVVWSLDRHLLWIRSHTVSWGQQCRWSEQQMA